MIFICKILRKFDINMLYTYPTHMYTVATSPCEIQEKLFFNSIIHICTHIILFTSSQKKTNCYPPHLKNVTTLPCKMPNFFIRLKICCIPPNVGGSDKNWLWCAANGLSGKQRYSICSKWPPSAQIHASSIFITDQLHRTPCSDEIQPMLQQDAFATYLYRGLVHDVREKIKDEKFVHFTR